MAWHGCADARGTHSGNSTLSRSLYEHGYTDLVNLDFSAAVIAMMAERTKDCPGMSWVEGDMMDLKQFEAGSFDVVLDKVHLATRTKLAQGWPKS